MASSRPLRGRRLQSPVPPPPQTRIKKESTVDRTDNASLDGWVEPAPRNLPPSFEDHKGLERQGVLEHMAPLGQLPGQKLKAKIKYQDPQLRRTQAGKNGEVRSAHDEASTEPPTAQVASRRNEPRRSTAPTRKRASSGRGDDDDEMDFETSAMGVTPTKMMSVPPATNGSPPQVVRSLKDIVESAASRANRVGNPSLAYAVRKLYKESQTSDHYDKLLVAVLHQRQTGEQAAEFQRYIKHARKEMKHEMGASGHTPSKLGSHSPKSTRTSVARQIGGVNHAAHAPDLKILASPSTRQSPSKHFSTSMAMNGTPSKAERASRRAKRNGSQSSLSSLSSVDSAAPDFAAEEDGATPPNGSGNHLPPQRTFQTDSKHPFGPRLGTFSSREMDAGRRPSMGNSNDVADTSSEHDMSSKRRKIRHDTSFPGYRVNDSYVRPVLHETRLTQTTPPTSSPLAKQPPSRLRNGPRKFYDDDDDDVLSSAPSSPGDLLVPPPFGALRGATPNQSSRRLNATKKSARIKISPVKKRNGVTAGIAQPAEPETSTRGSRRLDEAKEIEHSDMCSACSGNGMLICCDTCPRAYHFTCLEPPMDGAHPPDGEWHCPKCQKALADNADAEDGVFAELDIEMGGDNPSAFCLPHKVRDYFEGVKTNEQGEYEEPTTMESKKLRGTEADNRDTFKLKDSKDNYVNCFRCGESALGNREIVSCDFCPTSWHLDCMDPPLATAPSKRMLNREMRYSWKCPNHVDDLLENMQPPQKKAKTSPSIKPPTSRRYRLRRPKQPTFRNANLRRGFKNNGLIEIVNDPSDDEEEIDAESSSAIFRVQEKGLKLDFIERLRRLREENPPATARQDVHHSEATQTADAATDNAHATFSDRPTSERQAAATLSKLAELGTELTADPLVDVLRAAEATVVEEEELVASSSKGKGKERATTPAAETVVVNVDDNEAGDNEPAKKDTTTEEPVSDNEKEALYLEKFVEVALKRIDQLRGTVN